MSQKGCLCHSTAFDAVPTPMVRLRFSMFPNGSVSALLDILPFLHCNFNTHAAARVVLQAQQILQNVKIDPPRMSTNVTNYPLHCKFNPHTDLPVVLTTC